MFSNQLAIAALAGTCVTAAAGGGYLAARHNAAATAATPAHAAEMPAPSPDQAGLAPADQAPSSDGVAPGRATPAPLGYAPDAVARPARREPPATRAAVPRQRPAAAPPAAVYEPLPDPPAAEHAAVTPVPTTGLPVLAPLSSAHEEPREWQPPVPEEPSFREVVVRADSVIGLEIDTLLHSETAVLEDRVEARVARDVRVDGVTAIPAGARVIGSVVEVERGGRFKEQARLGVRFETLVLSDGTRMPISTETIYRLGNAPGKGTAARIGGGAVAGAILGGLLGGSKGAAIGASSGAGAGTAVVYAGDRSEAVFTSGLEVTARFLADVPVLLPAR